MAIRPLAAAVAAVLAAAAPALSAETLEIYTWADYFGARTLDAFTAATGVATSVDYFDGNEMLETRLLTGGSGFDLVFPAVSNAQREFAAGALLPIDTARLANYGNLDPAVVAALDAVPDWRRMGVPYTWGTIGIAYDPAAVAKRLGTDHLDSLDVFFRPELAAKFADCGIAMLDSPVEVTAIALAYVGGAPYGDDPDELARAGAVLSEAARRVRYFSNQRATSDLAGGDVCVALVYSGDAAIARGRAAEAGTGRTVAYSIPREGTLMWVDLMAIPADAPDPDLAYRFIDHVLAPEVAADVTDTVGFATANGPARALVAPEIRYDPGLYPDAATRARLFTDVALGPKALRARTRLWTRVKTGE